MPDAIPTPAALASRMAARDTASREQQETNRAARVARAAATQQTGKASANPGRMLTEQYAGQMIESVETPDADEHGDFTTVIIKLVDGRRIQLNAVVYDYEEPALEVGT
jgi:hypothetical protein